MGEEKKTVFLGSDHAGFVLKEEIKKYLHRLGVNYVDCGNVLLDKNDDYPDFVFSATIQAVKSRSFGIVFCGNGVGACIVANKVKGARAVNAWNVSIARQARVHNDTNILCLGGREIASVLAKRIIKMWLQTKFSGLEHHARRIAKIKKYEKNYPGDFVA